MSQRIRRKMAFASTTWNDDLDDVCSVLRNDPVYQSIVESGDVSEIGLQKLLKRLKNNLASQESRAKKKREFEANKQRVAELEKENGELKRKIQMLTKRSGKSCGVY